MHPNFPKEEPHIDCLAAFAAQAALRLAPSAIAVKGFLQERTPGFRMDIQYLGERCSVDDGDETPGN